MMKLRSEEASLHCLADIDTRVCGSKRVSGGLHGGVYLKSRWLFPPKLASRLSISPLLEPRRLLVPNRSNRSTFDVQVDRGRRKVKERHREMTVEGHVPTPITFNRNQPERLFSTVSRTSVVENWSWL